MTRAYTSRVVTRVEYLQSIRDGAEVKFPTESMSIYLQPLTGYQSVTGTNPAALPFPTSIADEDTAPEVVFEGDNSRPNVIGAAYTATIRPSVMSANMRPGFAEGLATYGAGKRDSEQCARIEVHGESPSLCLAPDVSASWGRFRDSSILHLKGVH